MNKYHIYHYHAHKNEDPHAEIDGIIKLKKPCHSMEQLHLVKNTIIENFPVFGNDPNKIVITSLSLLGEEML